MVATDFVIIICLLLSAFFSGMEIAFISSNKIFLEIEKNQSGITSAALKNITKNSSQFITAMLVGNNISLVVYGIFMGERILQLFFPEAAISGDRGFLVVFYQTLISTAIILATAEFLPKVFFQLYANTFIKIFAIPVALFYYLFTPITFLILKLTNTILKFFFKTENDKERFAFSKIELGHYIEEQLESSHDRENIDSEIQIFQNALVFSEVKAREAMIPRAEITAIEINTEVEDLKKIFLSTGHSKLPVYRETIDEIEGYVHVFEMFKEPKSINSVMLPVVFVPETMPINEALKTLTRRRKSMAVVIDEYGGTSGIMTIEDIVEELFGEIEDEHDTVERYEKQIGKGEFEFSARLEVNYLNETYRLNLPESEFYETLGGLVEYQIGEIPKEGDIVEIEKYQLKIKKVASTKIERIILTEI